MLKRNEFIMGKCLFLVLVITTFIYSFAIYSSSAQAAEIVRSGTEGTCSWEIDSDGLLRIFPTNGVSGVLENYSWNYNDWDNYDNNIPSWNSYSSEIKKCVIESGVKANKGVSYMFGGCSSLTTLDLSNFDTSNVTNMDRMFEDCSSLTTLDLSSFDTSKVTDMEGMFNGCSSLTTLDLSNFDTSKVTDMVCMFFGCSLTNLDLSNFETSKVTCMVVKLLQLQNMPTIQVTLEVSKLLKSRVVKLLQP